MYEDEFLEFLKNDERNEREIKGNYYYVNYEDIEIQLKPIHWRALWIIVSRGISEETVAINVLIESYIDLDNKYISEDTAWRAIRVLITLGLFEVNKIKTGYRNFDILILTGAGKHFYIKKFRKNPPVPEYMRILKDHASLIHGYMIKDVKHILEETGIYKSVSMSRLSNVIHLRGGKSVIPDLVCQTDNNQYYYYEVECGNHNQRDFNTKCNKLKEITTDIYIIGQNRTTVTKKLKPQVEKWIESVGKYQLWMSDVYVYLYSISDLKADKTTYFYDMESKEPICCFDKKN